MKMNTIGAAIVIVIIGIGGALYLITSLNGTLHRGAGEEAARADQTLSLGGISLAYASSDFGSATNPGEIQTKAYIPPCDSDFEYCLYYRGAAYAGTNFESAGLRVKERTDLASSVACLTPPPSGYPALKPALASTTEYAISTFAPVGDAGAGHYASGALYRLFYDKNCYEFETRIGASQFANYPAGSIKEFSATDQSAVTAMLMGVLKSLTLSSGTKPFQGI